MSVHSSRSYADSVFQHASPSDLFAKRSFDIATVSCAIFFLLPLLLSIVLVLVLTQGRPVIYRHTRLGRDGRPFQCLKFRSMVADADEILSEHLAENPHAAKEWAEFSEAEK